MKHVHWKTYSSAKMNDSQNPQEQVHKKDVHAFDSARYFMTLMPNLAPHSADTLSGQIKGLQEAEKQEEELGTYFDSIIAMREFKKFDSPIASIKTRWQTVSVGANLSGESGYESE